MERLYNRVVNIGGGTGMTTLLEAQTLYVDRDFISLVITTSDDGGDYSRWRGWFGSVAGGDIRKASGPLTRNPYFNRLKEFRFPKDSGYIDGLSLEEIICRGYELEFRGFRTEDPIATLISVDREDPGLQELLNFRFHDGDQKLDKACIGNAILTAAEIVASYHGLDVNEAIRNYQRVFGIEGQIYPATLKPTTIVAKFGKSSDPGFEKTVEGEDNIGDIHHDQEYDNTFFLRKIFQKERAKLNPLAKQALIDADRIYLAMGSLYTSVIAAGLAEDFNQTIEQSQAECVVIVGLVATPGESYPVRTASAYLNEIKKYYPALRICRVLMNDHRLYQHLPQDVRDRYTAEGKFPIEADQDTCELIYPNAKIEVAPLAVMETEHRWIRHDVRMLGHHLYHGN